MMKRKPEVLPSVLSFDFKNIAGELKRMKEAGLTVLHYDVMDGHFVRNVSFGESLYEQLVPEGFEGNVHLMITNPLLHTKFFFQIGAKTVIVHYEALKDYMEGFLKAEDEWRKGKCLGIAINPDTPLEEVFPHLKDFDLVMLMTVYPGASGQSFIPNGFERIRRVREYLDNNGIDIPLEVDGGINDKTGPEAIKAGADLLVSGSYLCKSVDLENTKKAILGISNHD